jgi:arsenate reductase-like glutaredoxin family protein
METKTNEMTFIYRSDKADDNKIKAFVESLPGYVIKFVDVVRDSLSESQLNDLTRKMKVHIEDLVDPAFDHHISVHNEGLRMLERKEILSLMATDPKIIQTPLVVIGNKASKFANAYKLFRNAWSNPFGSI